MRISSEEKQRLAANARTLEERLDTPTEGAVTSDEVADDRMKEWQQNIRDDDFNAFLQRLAISDLSIEACRRRLADTGWPEDEPPEWTDWIDDILVHVDAAVPTVPAYDTDDEDDVPFVHLLEVIVEYASGHVDWDAELTQFSQEARDAFHGWLLERLRQLFAHSLFIEFKTYLAERDRDLALASEPEMPSAPRRYYSSFVADLFEEGLKHFFLEYSVLARLLVGVIDRWIESIQTFGSRLAADRDTIRERFGRGEPLGDVVDIEFLGDRHQGGKQVFAVSFESGVTVAYKPRSIEPEASFNRLLTWFNENTDLPALRTVECLPRTGYGWMEWVSSEPCAALDDVATYYYRAGSLLCLLYVLNFTDGHLENVVAVGDQPVVIDLETICQPTLSNEKVPTESKARNLIRESVLGPGFLPLDLPGSKTKDVGGLHMESGRRIDSQIPEFERTNTDVMELTYRQTATIEGESLPHVNGDRIEPTEHYEDIVLGFERAYRFLMENADAIVREDAPLDAFESIECRFLFRSTAEYRTRLVHLTTPSHLRNGVAFGCKTERLTEPFVAGTLSEEMWPVYEAERKALWRFDVPRFTVGTNGTDLRHDGRTIRTDVFETSPIEQVRRRIEGLNETDLQEQLDYITLAYTSGESVYTGGVSGVDEADLPPDAETLVGRRSRGILGRIHESSHLTYDGETNWHLRKSYDERRLTLEPIAEHLYGGRMGVGVFSAGLAAVTGNRLYHDFAEKVVAPLVDELDDAEPFSDMKVGAGKGVASLVYGFAVLGELLDSNRATEAASQFATLLTPERLESETLFDVLNGSAGAVLGLLALYDRTGDDPLLDAAITAGDYLLSSRVEVNGCRAWKTTVHEVPLTGFSHGVAGIAYALYRLGDESGEGRFRDAALESLAFERSNYSRERGGWPDLYPTAGSSYNPGWSAGSSGIGLARLGMYEINDRDDLKNEITTALRHDDGSLTAHDHLSVGNFGRVEFLMRAGRTLDDERLQERARRLARTAVARAEARGRFTVLSQTEHWYNPSFFTGESGIGYTLLRLTNPELPCVLLWE